MANQLDRRSNEGRVERVHHMRRPSDVFSPLIENILSPFDDWFDDYFLTRRFDTRSLSRLDLDIDETDKEYVICADLPGVSKDEISIDTSGNQLTISGVRHWDRKSRGQEYRQQEQGEQTFRRTFTLPTGVEMDKVEANYSDGVLTITVPKGESLKSRRIQIGEGRSSSSNNNTRLSASTKTQ